MTDTVSIKRTRAQAREHKRAVRAHKKAQRAQARQVARLDRMQQRQDRRAQRQQMRSRDAWSTQGSRPEVVDPVPLPTLGTESKRPPARRDELQRPLARVLSTLIDATSKLVIPEPIVENTTSDYGPILGIVDRDVARQATELPLMAMTQLLPRPGRPVLQAETEHPPLVMIHGLGGSGGNFGPIRAWLALHRNRPTYVFDYRGYGDMFAAAAAFGPWLDDIIAMYGSTRIEILAHSMGGLIMRLALTDTTRASHIGQVLTLGTPHLGTNLARLGGSTFIRQLRVGSEVFAALEEQEGPILPYRMTCLWTQRDVLVLPATNAIMPSTPSFAMHQSTHLSWLLKPSYIDKVFEILDADRLVPRHGEHPDYVWRSTLVNDSRSLQQR